MSVALSGGQEITSAFSRSLYYTTPYPRARPHRSTRACLCVHGRVLIFPRMDRGGRRVRAHVHGARWICGRSCLVRRQLPGPEIRVYTSVVYSHGIRYIYLGLTIMRLVANGMDTHTCRRATTRKTARSDASITVYFPLRDSLRELGGIHVLSFLSLVSECGKRRRGRGRIWRAGGHFFHRRYNNRAGIKEQPRGTHKRIKQ